MQDKIGKILVIDDDKDILLSSRVVLKREFSMIQTESDPFKIPELIRKEDYDAVLLDMNFSTGSNTGKEGIHWLKEILKIKPETNVIMITAFGEVNTAVEAMKNGAIDFIVKPWENEKLIATVFSAVKLSQSKNEIQQLKIKQNNLSNEIEKDFIEMIGESESIRKVYADIEKIKSTDANVLILGENGSGKELVARAIHRQSNRSNQIFVNVDMGSIHENLFESELFGHKKGAFTDASNDKSGRFEIANGGSLFLDEIGNLNLNLQAKLLSVLEKREITRLGENKARPIDIRLIAATNMPLSKMIEEGRFREDLFYRINTIEIKLPPLRDRMEDIPLFLDFFIKHYSDKYAKKNIGYTKELVKHLKKHNWPGNIRELRHMIERAIIMCESKNLNPIDFPIHINKDAETIKSLNLESIEKKAILSAIEKNKGNLSKACKELGMGRTTLYRKMNKYGI